MYNMKDNTRSPIAKTKGEDKEENIVSYNNRKMVKSMVKNKPLRKVRDEFK